MHNLLLLHNDSVHRKPKILNKDTTETLKRVCQGHMVQNQ